MVHRGPLTLLGLLVADFVPVRREAPAVGVQPRGTKCRWLGFPTYRRLFECYRYRDPVRPQIMEKFKLDTLKSIGSALRYPL